MEANDFKGSIDYLFQNHKSNADDIYECLELLSTYLEDSYDAINNDIFKFNKKREISTANDIQQFLMRINDIQKGLKTLLGLFEDNDSDIIESDLADDDESDNEHSSGNIDYSQYEVNRDIPHMLSEDYKHKKICGFMLEGTRYNVNNWQDALVKLCNLLYKKDAEKFKSFLTMDEFMGRKIKYFDTKSVEDRNCIINGTNIYVWINLSANGKRTLMKKVLRQFAINTNTFFIFLRADLSPLHMDSEIDDDTAQNDSDEKIGKYVRTKMRQLSAEKYIFNADALKALLDKAKSKKLIGVNYPFFKIVDEAKPIPAQAKDESGRSRYWKEVFNFNNQSFLITSQWFDYNRDGFDKWYNALK